MICGVANDVACCVAYGMPCHVWHLTWHVVCGICHDMWCVIFGMISGV